MDFLQLKPELSAKIAVLNPVTKEEMPGVTYTLAGRTSPEFRAAKRLAEKYSDAEERGVATFAGAITGWEGFQEGGVPIEPTLENKQRFLDEYDWLLKQVIERFTEDETFLPNARNASALSQPSEGGAQPKSGK